MKMQRSISIFAAVFAVGGAFAQQDMKDMAMSKAEGYVYTLDNATNGNHVLVFARMADGSLKKMGAPVSTGGKGAGAMDLDDQNGLIVHGHHLIATNPGSNDITIFNIEADGTLHMIGKTIPSGGHTPLSLAVNGDMLYVANQAADGTTPNIMGFKMDMSGTLKPVMGARFEFPKGQGPAQIEFSPNGKILAATAGFQNAETSRVYTFQVMDNGMLMQAKNSPKSTGSVSGDVGFSWGKNSDRLFVSNFRGSAIAVFNVNPNSGELMAGMVHKDNETAACWTVLSKDGRTLYVANFVSNSISAFDVMSDGTLKLMGSVKRRGGDSPDLKDLVLSNDGKFLYALNTNSKQISVFQIGMDRLPKELGASMSPVTQMGGEAWKGLAIK